MSAFNRLKCFEKCPDCKNLNEFMIQFKFGDTWQYEYKIGDHLKWGRNNYGKPNIESVVVDAVSEEGVCKFCGRMMEDFEIFIEKDRITSAQLSSGKYEFLDATFVVLKE